MSKKMKLALLALLGFSTACSTVKSGAKADKNSDQVNEETSTVQIEGEAADERPQIRVLYGVRPPVPAEEAAPAEQPTPESQPEAESK